MDNKKKIIIGIIAGVIFIIAFLLNLFFPPKPFIKSAHADGFIHPFIIDSGSLNQTIAIGDATLQDWLEAGGLADDQYTYNDFNIDLASMVLGAYTGISSNYIDAALERLYNGLLGLTFYLDTSSGFIAVPNEVYGILDDIKHDYGYNPAQDTIGYWYPLPVTVSISNQSSSQRQIFSSSSDVYMCCIGKSGSGDWTKCDLAFAVKGSDTASFSFYGGNFPVETPYTGSVSSGFYTTRYGSYFHDIGIAPTSWDVYSSLSAALDDFFGNEISDEPTFNGNVFLTDTFPPLNILDLPGNDGKNKSVQRNQDLNNNVVNPYGGFNNIVLTPDLKDIPNNYDYQYPIYPEIPHDLPEVSLSYPQVEANQEIQDGMNGLNSLWVILLTMGGSFIVLKVIL